jgi:excinuclease ABC subunit B
MNVAQLVKAIEHTRQNMLAASKKLDFILAAQYRDEMLKMQEILEKMS